MLQMKSIFCRLNLWRSISRKHRKTDKGRSSDLFPPCGLPTLRAVTIENARSVMKLTATGIVSDLHRSSLFILGDWCHLKHLNPRCKNTDLFWDIKKVNIFVANLVLTSISWSDEWKGNQVKILSRHRCCKFRKCLWLPQEPLSLKDGKASKMERARRPANS